MVFFVDTHTTQHILYHVKKQLFTKEFQAGFQLWLIQYGSDRQGLNLKRRSIGQDIA